MPARQIEEGHERLQCPYCGAEDIAVVETEISTAFGEVYVLDREEGQWDQEVYDSEVGDGGGEFESFRCQSCQQEFEPNDAGIGKLTPAHRNLHRWLNGMAEGVLEAIERDDGQVRDDSLRDYASQMFSVSEKVLPDGRILWRALKDEVGTDVDDA